MKKQIDNLVSKVLRLSFVAATLLLTAESCYTPWQKNQTEKEAIAQFAVVKKSIYVPPDAILLAEIYFHDQDNHFGLAGVEQIYTDPRPCMEIIDEYRTQMINTGWTLVNSANSCDQVIRLDMRTQGDMAEFIVEAHPSSKSRLADRWQLFQNQYQNLYYVDARLAVPYDK